MKIRVIFFGVLAEITGLNIKYYSNVSSVDEVRMRIEEDYPAIVHYSYRISLNNEFINHDQKLSDDDELALVPPFAGG